MHESLKVAWRAIDDVRPYEGNPRIIPETAVAKVAASIREFGWRQPIVIDPDGVIVAGHTRYRAALSLGLKRVPVHVAEGMTPTQLRAFRLADNRTHDETRWNPDALDMELAGLAGDFDLSLAGFDPIELPSGGIDITPIAESEVKPLDARDRVSCPNCGHEFEP
ncbi:ParB N-terminal domain-containing protein [Ancylobacter defluvii]|uniref:ParB-like N-terminal domain-containing protein n=1 Tax=Ancylobacter defluvii TaxID=1282440 RepID=A0A9W6K0R5_9HYPH|nr:ParB N-terminal domain-containing protein [Ancylobacter defluvii]MBS7588276.1 ParB N-terminal domain-containing protein [Ancylobacter defluvii]GLK86672.1 hypothetical protein GCM10017653_47420 [Ancylobacter defluvii]